MITSLKFNNCFAFNNSIEMNLRADMRTKKFASNVININKKLNVLKSAVIYGPNNTGKTTFINSIKAIKRTLENKDIRLMANIFTESPICDAGVSFVYEEKEYSYEFKFDCREHLYLYEKMAEILRDQHGNESEKLIFIKDTIANHYECPDDENLEKVLNITSNNNILIYTVQIEKFAILQKIKEILLSVANSLVIIDMNRVPIAKTIEILKNKNKETQKIVNFIKSADVYLEDFIYEENLNIEIDDKEINDKILKDQNLIDQIRLTSVYKGKKVSSMLFDSLGTKKIAALASYIITAIEEGKTLIIDELDSSLHFKITRAIISMFNNEINKSAQLIATLHDVSLLDCIKLFRKEQIWFTNKDDRGTELYSLKEFTYAENGVRDSSDIKEKYSKGEFEAIPDPDLISALLEVDIIEEN